VAESRFDDITVDQLVAQGSLKWTKTPGHLAAFVAEMDFGTAPEVTRALEQVTSTSLLGYLPPAAARDMSLATSEFLHTRFGWEVSPSRIYPTADVLSAYEVVLAQFSKPGSAVIVPTPAYMPFLSLTAMRKREVIQVPMVVGEGGRWEMDLEAIDTAFSQGAQLLVLCNPHNPLGRVYTKPELHALQEVVSRHGGRVFSDDIHAPITFDHHRHIPYASISPEAASHTLTATSASKAWNIPGLKCAQLIVSNDADQRAFADIAFMVSHGASTPGVIANAAAYRGGGAWFDEVLAYIDHNRILLAQALETHIPTIQYHQPEGTYIAWLDATGLPNVAGGRSWAKFFSDEAHVSLTDGALCGEAGVGHLRLILATPAHIVEKIVRSMAQALKRAQSA